ncbi:conserved hypothetical protein [Neospora caninum Liverpool]|uniref:HTH OST-type domain-containing protein n=1 Tax=Neospora caninum (strain Liverpool) TaxID=572307 RepID=F0VFV8_NEOCL|nr:conserved hypothetical protein [Neospora caninum Liverpool]CBZ52602.1 conserved hypothetical protein [Neospora caninum Liverpool]CEL66580.1 TPA: hypothetical protein BN1204_023910 [Neospora caninum Liverpool]|eukprot:XP_003882634.1 conserved hypothetical protein [Neospora caninum Liverpool]
MGNEQGALERAQKNPCDEHLPPGPQCPLKSAGRSSATIGTGEEEATVAKEESTPISANSSKDVTYIDAEPETLSESPSLRVGKDTAERTRRRPQEQHERGTAPPSSKITEGPQKNKQSGAAEGTENANLFVASENCDREKKTKSSMEVLSAPLLTDPGVPNGAGAEGPSPACVLSPANSKKPPLDEVKRKDKEHPGNEKLDTSLKHNDHSIHDENNPHFSPTDQTVYTLPTLLHVWQTTNGCSERDKKVALRNSVSHTEAFRGENEEEQTPLTGWRLCERDVYCDSSPPSAQRGSAGISPVAACRSPAGLFQNPLPAPVADFGVPPTGRSTLSPSPAAAVPPPHLPCHQPLRDVSSLQGGQSSPAFDAASPPFHETHADTQIEPQLARQGPAPRGARLNPLAPAFEPPQILQLQHLRAAATVSGASTTCSLRSAQGKKVLLTSIPVHDTRPPVGRTVSYVFPQRQSYSPILRCSSTGPSVAQQRPLLVPHPPPPFPRMDGLGTSKRGGLICGTHPASVSRYTTMPAHSGCGHPNSGGASWGFGTGRAGASATSRGLYRELAEVVDPAEANKLLLQLGRKMRLTHLQVQVVVKKAGPSGLRLTDLPAAFLKEHNAVLDLRSLGLLQIRELIAGMSRALVLEADEPPVAPQAAVADGERDGPRSAELQKRSSRSPSPSRVAAVSALGPGTPEKNDAGKPQLSSQKSHLQGGKTEKTEWTARQSPRVFAVDDESRLKLKLGEPLPPVMKELLQHLLISLVADALHHATPPASVATWTATGSPEQPAAGLSRPPTHAASLATVMSPEALSPQALPSSQSPETRVPSPRSIGFESSPALAFSLSPTEKTHTAPDAKEGEREPGKRAASPGTPGFVPGTGSKKLTGSSPNGGTNKGLPIHILPTLWQLKYGLRCNLSAMLETCGYTSLRTFILDELPSLHISPSGSQVTLRLTPTAPRAPAPKTAHPREKAALDGKQTLQDGSKMTLQALGSAPPQLTKPAVSPSGLNAGSARRERPLDSAVKKLNPRSLLSTRKATHPTIEAVATAAVAAVQASGVSLSTLLVALSSAARRQAARGADAGSTGENQCGGRPQAVGSMDPSLYAAGPQEASWKSSAGGAGAPPAAMLREALHGSPTRDTEGSWPLVEEGSAEDRPQQPAMETTIRDSAYPKEMVDKAISEEARSNEGLRHASPSFTQQRAPPLASLPVDKGKPIEAGALSSHTQSPEMASSEIAADAGSSAQKSPFQTKSGTENAQPPAPPVECELVSRLHLHRMLYEVIALGCEKRGRRWARGEDLIELEEELQQFKAAALKSKELQASGPRGGKGTSSAAVADRRDAGAQTKQTEKSPPFFGFSSSSLPASTGCETGGEGGGRLLSCSPGKTPHAEDKGEDAEHSTDEDDSNNEHNGAGSTPSSAVKGDDSDEKKTETEAGDATPEAGEEAQLVDARLLRRRMKKREKKEKKKRKREKLRALDEHEMEQRRLLSLVDLMRLPPSPSTAQHPLGTASPFSLADEEDGPSSPFSHVSPSGGQPHSGVTLPPPGTSLPHALGACEQGENAVASKDGTKSLVPFLSAAEASDGVAGSAPAAVSRSAPGPERSVSADVLSGCSSVGSAAGVPPGDADQLLSLATPPQRPISQLRLSLSPEELATELQSFHNRAIGMLVCAIKVEWERHFGPQTPSLQAYMDHFQVRQLKALLLEVPNLLIVGSGGKMRVSTLEHAMQFCNPFPPPSTVFASPAGKKISLPLTMTPSSPLPWFRAHAYTHDVGSNASVLSHLETETVGGTAEAFRHSQGGECEGGEAPEACRGQREHPGKGRREKTSDTEEERRAEGQRATSSAPLRNEKREIGEQDTEQNQRDDGDDKCADARCAREGEREKATAPSVSPPFARRAVPPESALKYMHHSLLPSRSPGRVDPSRTLVTERDDNRVSNPLPCLLPLSASQQRRRDERMDTKGVVPRQPVGLSAEEKPEGLIRHTPRSDPTRPPPHLSSSRTEGQRQLNEEAVGTLLHVAPRKHRETDGKSHPFSSTSESVYPMPPGFSRLPPVSEAVPPPARASVVTGPPSFRTPRGRPPPPGQTVSAATSPHGSSSHSEFPRPSAPQHVTTWGSESPPDSGGRNVSSTALPPWTVGQGGALSQPPCAVAQKPLPPDTIADLERLLVRLLLMDPPTGSAAAAAAAGLSSAPAPTASPELSGCGSVSFSSLLTLVKAAQQLHRSNENLWSHDDSGGAREEIPAAKREAEAQPGLAPDMDARSQVLSFQSSRASTPPSPPTQGFSLSPSPSPLLLQPCAPRTRHMAHAEDRREVPGEPRRFPTCSAMQPIPGPPGITCPFRASPPYGDTEPAHMFRYDSFGGRRSSLENLNEQGGMAPTLPQLSLQRHMEPRAGALLGNGPTRTAPPGAWKLAIPLSGGFPGVASSSAASGASSVSVQDMISRGCLTEAAEKTLSHGDHHFDRNGRLGRGRAMERDAHAEQETKRAWHSAGAFGSEPAGIARPMQRLQEIYQPEAVTAYHGCMSGGAPPTRSGPLSGPGAANWEPRLTMHDAKASPGSLARPAGQQGTEETRLIPHAQMDMINPCTVRTYLTRQATQNRSLSGLKSAHKVLEGDGAGEVRDRWGGAVLSGALRREPEGRERARPGYKNVAHKVTYTPHRARERDARNHFFPSVVDAPCAPGSLSSPGDSQGDGRLTSPSFPGSRGDGAAGLGLAGAPGLGTFLFEERREPDKRARCEGPNCVGRGRENMALQRKEKKGFSEETRRQEKADGVSGLRTDTTTGLRSEVEWTEETSLGEEHAEKGKDALLDLKCSGDGSGKTEEKLQVPWTRLHPSRRTDSPSRVRKRQEAPTGRRAKVVETAKEAGCPGDALPPDEAAHRPFRSVSSSAPSLPHASSSLSSSPFSARVPVSGVQPVTRRGREKTKRTSAGADVTSPASRQPSNLSPALQMPANRKGKSLLRTSKKELRAAEGWAADAESKEQPRGVSSRQATNTEKSESRGSQHRRKDKGRERSGNVERRGSQHERDKLHTFGGSETGTPGSQQPGGSRESLLWRTKNSEDEAAMWKTG